MPRGAAVVRNEGTRGAVWRIKYRDAAGRQVQETLGPEPPWTERMAQRELGKRLAAVDDGFRKPDHVTFADFADRFTQDYLPGRKLKRSTIENYRYMLDGHLLPVFGDHDLAELEAQPELIDAYVAAKARSGLSAKTIQNQLLLLNVMLRRAVVWRLIRSNPISSIDRPSLTPPEMSVLTETEIVRLANAYDELIADASDASRMWWTLAKAIVLTALGTALRRGELIGLRWGTVNLLEAKIEVRETFVRGRFTTPKSRASRRVVELGPRTLAVLEEQWQRTAYRGDDDLVFGHPTKGTPLETGKLAKCYLKPALARAGIKKPFRPFHDLRHTSLTHAAAAGNPQIYVQARAGHSQGSITERYMHAAQVLFPGAAEKSEARMFGELGDDVVPPA
ncbi:MAG: site-specific integrase [Gaiella sp.]|nr:site-specific integrase [Gaiella sp.]